MWAQFDVFWQFLVCFFLYSLQLLEINPPIGLYGTIIILYCETVNSPSRSVWDSFMLVILFLQFKQNQQLDKRFLSAVVSVGFLSRLLLLNQLFSLASPIRKSELRTEFPSSARWQVDVPLRQLLFSDQNICPWIFYGLALTDSTLLTMPRVLWSLCSRLQLLVFFLSSQLWNSGLPTQAAFHTRPIFSQNALLFHVLLIPSLCQTSAPLQQRQTSGSFQLSVTEIFLSFRRWLIRSHAHTNTIRQYLIPDSKRLWSTCFLQPFIAT